VDQFLRHLHVNKQVQFSSGLHIMCLIPLLLSRQADRQLPNKEIPVPHLAVCTWSNTRPLQRVTERLRARCSTFMPSRTAWSCRMSKEPKGTEMPCSASTTCTARGGCTIYASPALELTLTRHRKKTAIMRARQQQGNKYENLRRKNKDSRADPHERSKPCRSSERICMGI